MARFPSGNGISVGFSTNNTELCESVIFPTPSATTPSVAPNPRHPQLDSSQIFKILQPRSLKRSKPFVAGSKDSNLIFTPNSERSQLHRLPALSNAMKWVLPELTETNFMESLVVYSLLRNLFEGLRSCEGCGFDGSLVMKGEEGVIV
ncbi:hypothetical protein WICPIJ_002186 [Wickerhamomyces pijperi]|uniref:Uncharacterized protein n=1 Tax=Wickerhamomyces pijperi TaxID=599730 RepID=A0A9P8QCF3_WICPI|nr:hypothetical protein WICPIJ_002186 [Wickerhamomyces pijperi]